MYYRNKINLQKLYLNDRRKRIDDDILNRSQSEYLIPSEDDNYEYYTNISPNNVWFKYIGYILLIIIILLIINLYNNNNI